MGAAALTSPTTLTVTNEAWSHFGRSTIYLTDRRGSPYWRVVALSRVSELEESRTIGVHDPQVPLALEHKLGAVR